MRPGFTPLRRRPASSRRPQLPRPSEPGGPTMSFDFFLPVLTYPDPTPVAGLTRALDMAASIGGRLSPLIAEIDIPPLHNAFAEMMINVSAMAAEAEKRSRETGDQIGAEIEHLGRRLSLPVKLA